MFLRRLNLKLSYNTQVENPFAYKGDLAPELSTLVIAYPELIAELDFRDNRRHPERPAHSGVFLRNDLQVAGHIFGGRASDVKVQPEIRTYLPLGRRVTFATRASVGFLFASNYGDVIRNHLNEATTDQNKPERVRDIETVFFRGFFSGGPTQNRGFPVRGIAPHGFVPFLNPATAAQQVALDCDPNTPGVKDPDICSISIGGFSLWELSNEVRFNVSGPLSAATFCDMSDVAATVKLNFTRLHLSCGLGARYDTPVGPIRLDVGYRVQPLQELGRKDELEIYQKDPTQGKPPTILEAPIAVSFGIGEAF